MKKRRFVKTMVLVTIILFLGASILPNISGSIEEKININNKNETFLLEKTSSFVKQKYGMKMEILSVLEAHNFSEPSESIKLHKNFSFFFGIFPILIFTFK